MIVTRINPNCSFYTVRVMIIRRIRSVHRNEGLDCIALIQYIFWNFEILGSVDVV